MSTARAVAGLVVRDARLRFSAMTKSGKWLVGLSLGGAFFGCTQATSSGFRGDIGGEQYRALETAALTPLDVSRTERAGHSIQTVFLIVMENHNWSQIKGSPSAPYINGTLLPMGAHAEHYRPGGIHPSEPNYVWLEAGDNLGILDDAPPAFNDRTTKAHLVTLLDAVGVRWKSYQEGIDGLACPLDAVGLYDPKHDPMVYFDDVRPGCVEHVRPYSELAGDLSAGTTADYNFIVPNLCNDMHNAGCGTGDQVRNGDTWLSTEVPRIMESAAYKKGGAIFITWDEGGGSESPIGMIVLSPFAKAGYAGQMEYSHSSTLRTMQEIFAVQPFLRAAANSTSLGDLFVSYP
jgi:phosphatidylinositol-3-phosphatase